MRDEAEEICTSLLADLGEDLRWQWDDRFRAALTQFDSDQKDDIQNTLHQHLALTWESGSLKGAPDSVKATIASVGGLQSGQMLLTSEVNSDEFVYCAWWPWGNGETISIRVAPSWLATSEDDQAQTVDLVKSWFGIAIN